MTTTLPSLVFVIPGVIFYCLTPTDRHTECLEIALAHGANVNNVHNDGLPEIVAACETASDNEAMCLKLIAKKANVNAVNEVSVGRPMISLPSMSVNKQKILIEVSGITGSGFIR